MTDATPGRGETPDELPPLTPEESAFVSDTLAALPDEPMPDEVWQRLSLALAAEAPAPTTVLPQIPGQRSRGPGSDGQRDGSRRWLPVAAGVAVLAVGGLFGAQLLDAGDDGSVVADGSASTEAAAAVPVVQSGTSYTSAGFEQQVTTALLPVVDDVVAPAVSPARSATPPAGSPSPDLRFSPAPEWLSAMDLPGCLEAVDPAADPLLVDAASYDAEAALVITYSAGTGRLDVYAVSSACSPADVDLLRYLSVAAD